MNKLVSLGSFLTLRYGKALGATDRQQGDVEVIGSSGVIGSHDKALLAGPSVVVGRKGSVGKTHWSSGASWPIDTTYYVDADPGRVDLRWSYWLLKALPWTR